MLRISLTRQIKLKKKTYSNMKRRHYSFEDFGAETHLLKPVKSMRLPTELEEDISILSIRHSSESIRGFDFF